jgi:hypothetical protein
MRDNGRERKLNYQQGAIPDRPECKTNGSDGGTVCPTQKMAA